MKFIVELMNRHIICCPKCSDELYFDASSASADYLKCMNKECNSYFLMEKNNKRLIESGSYSTVLVELQKKGINDWPGIATSIAYKPRWVKMVEFLLRKK